MIDFPQNLLCCDTILHIFRIEIVTVNYNTNFRFYIIYSKKKRKKKRKSNRPRVSSPPALKGLFSTAVPDEDLYDGGGDSTPEPLSDAEDDDGATESIISSVCPVYDHQAAEEKMLSQQSTTPGNVPMMWSDLLESTTFDMRISTLYR